ncbi:LLM class flavin-dependent oxidoreductase [Nocardioides sp. zg-536]|uniref:LLM class flavin-dependent oxidoreductase n=1 Tax=Nocardioides faecalis TaxID=2803858 RepID=A0A939BVJ8_9ACTN|nr:LLM class flavin-dependent oxidoreductase [Nocardioides faecalis]MBM9460031.1 LLM class flavin-dependent oxidoreductase [Nocardioides faecalis]MBS4753101.1 LLM class flavin-dependent oxidoreductase [Nocardioides faecalis]QVI58749.1 LLM class flavin-dependent oxidoreductase [Nocardioides faecalis]
MAELQLGLDTFGDVTADASGAPLSHAQVLRDVVEQAVLADTVGVDAIGLGEHHRDDFAISAPDVVLAAIAARTERIVLGTAVTVLSSDDPVRLYERFATLDALAGGRVEVTLGRGSFTESFPLFGYDLAHYEQLFSEKLDLWAALQGEGTVTWDAGRLRPPLRAARIFPHTDRGSIPTWIGVGGSPESVVRAAQYGFGLMLAIIGGEPARFAPYADLYRRALTELGKPPLPIGVHSPGFVADTDGEARELLFPHFKANRDRIGAERGWGPVTRAQYDAEVETGALFVGSPETVARKIADTARTLGLDRFDLKYSNGPLPHEHLMRCIELYGKAVIPRVRELLAEEA